ncbi:MAG TPA: hypothetical protein VF169_12450 [Albitalea sp.]|uniref:hypothetical protein n=1 Tax=Piscinibacter sp. TaxID=1903157 RepID=UPI002ECFF99A
MHRCWIALIAAGVGVACRAQEPRSLQTDECRQALDALQARQAEVAAAAERQDPAARREEIRKQSESARRQAARVCLGGRGDALPATNRLTEPYIAVPPGTAARPVPAPAPPAVPRVSMPQRVDPPPMVTACDAAGCWTSDGSRVQRAGPNLVEPRGICVREGLSLRCP